MIAVRPSRTSSPETRSSRFLIRPHSSPQWLTSEVSAERKPSSWVPPSGVLMVLAKVCTDSVKETFHCIATSRLRSCVEPWTPALCSASKRDHRRVGQRLALVEVLDEVDEPAVVAEGLLDAARLGLWIASAPTPSTSCGDRVVLHRLEHLGRRRTLVADHDLEALVEEGVLAHPRGDRLEGVRRGLEDVGRRPVGDGGAGALPRLELAHVLELAVRDADAEGLAPEVAAVLHLDDEPARQRVHDADADAVQTTGDLVAAAAELAAGVQHGEHGRDGRELLARRGVGRDAAAVVLDPHAAVGEQGHHDPVAVAGQGLVDGVVDDLPDQVVQTALAGRADVHAGALADRLEALEDLDRGRVVLDAVGRLGHQDCEGRTRSRTASESRRSRAPLRRDRGHPRGARDRSVTWNGPRADERAASDSMIAVYGPSLHASTPRRGASVDEIGLQAAREGGSEARTGVRTCPHTSGRPVRSAFRG